MKEFQVCWAYEQDFSTIIEGSSEEEVRQKFLDGDFDTGEVNENDGRMVDGSVEISEVNE